MLQLTQQHTVRHELDTCSARDVRLVPDLIADNVAEWNVQLVCDTFRHRVRSNTTRLRASNHHMPRTSRTFGACITAALPVACLEQELRDLRCLSGSSLADDDDNVVVCNRFHHTLLLGADRQLHARLLHFGPPLHLDPDSAIALSLRRRLRHGGIPSCCLRRCNSSLSSRSSFLPRAPISQRALVFDLDVCVRLGQCLLVSLCITSQRR